MKVKNLSEQRAELVEAAQSIIDGAKAAGRGLSDEDRAAVDAHLATIKDLDAKIAEKAKNERLMNEVGALFGSSDAPNDPFSERGSHTRGAKGDTREGYISLKSLDDVVAPIAHNLIAGGTKAALTEGQIIETQRVFESPITMGRPASSVWDLIPTRLVEPTYSVMRQTLRDGQAAVVAPGDTKPTSHYLIKRVEERLRIIATLSDPIHEFDLLDFPALTAWLRDELRYSVFTAIEREAFLGDGQGESMTGLLNTSGLQVQAKNGDEVRTVRSAITGLEGQGYTPDALFLNPHDWEKIETSTYLLNDNAASPVDRAARRLWGLPVATSNVMPEGTAVMKSAGSVALMLNERGSELKFGVVGDSFAKNEVIARVETRANLSVFQPAGVTKINLAA